MSRAALTVIALGAAGAVGLGIWLLGYVWDCHARWAESGLAVKHERGVCLVEVHGKWWPEQAIRVHHLSPSLPRSL
jgi:hypothetical protein